MNSTNSDKKYRFSIYRVVRPEKLRAAFKKHSYQKISTKPQYAAIELFVQLPPKRRLPPWLDLLVEMAENPSEIADLRSASASFVVTIKTEENMYAFCGGAGSQITRYCSDEEFGIEVASRLLSEGQVRHMGTTHAAGMIVHREITSRAYLYPQLRSDALDRIVVKLIGDIDLAEAERELGVSIVEGRPIKIFAGRSSLRLSKSLSLDELLKFVNRLDGIRKLDPKIEIVKGCEEVTEGEMRKKLDLMLSEKLAEQFEEFIQNPDDFAESSIGISYFDWTKHIGADSHRLRIGKEESPVELVEYDLWSVFDALYAKKRRIRFAKSYLTNIVIDSYDDQGVWIFGKPLKALLMAEVEVEGNTAYSLFYGKWYRVQDDFREQVEHKFVEFLNKSEEALRGFSVPCWPKDEKGIITEPNYVKKACSDEAKLHQMHNHHIYFSRGDKGELCDIYDNRETRPRLIFIKRGLTTVMRELTAQAVASATFLRRVTAFVTGAISEVKRAYGVEVDEDTLRTAPIVLAVVDYKLNRPNKPIQEIVGLAVKLEVIRASDEIGDLGFPSVTLYRVAHCS